MNCKTVIMILFVVLNCGALMQASPSLPNEKANWTWLVDPSVATKPHRNLTALSEEEKIQIIECMLSLEGRKECARISGATSFRQSFAPPPSSIEVAALFFIDYIYHGKWDFCNGIALVDENGQYNTGKSIVSAFAAHRRWFGLIKKFGLKVVIEMGIDPMFFCIEDAQWR